MLETVNTSEQSSPQYQDLPENPPERNLSSGEAIASPADQDELETIDDVEMSLFDHLEELRSRIFYALIAIFLPTEVGTTAPC